MTLVLAPFSTSSRAQGTFRLWTAYIKAVFRWGARNTGEQRETGGKQRAENGYLVLHVLGIEIVCKPCQLPYTSRMAVLRRKHRGCHSSLAEITSDEKAMSNSTGGPEAGSVPLGETVPCT